MNYGIQVGEEYITIGSWDTFRFFFVNIAGHSNIEKYPVLVGKFYENQTLAEEDASAALAELDALRIDFASKPAKNSISAPEGTPVEERARYNMDAENLAEYFLTSDGKNLIDAFQEAFTKLRDQGGEASIVEIGE